MSLPQEQPYTRGQVLDRSRGEYRSRCYPAPTEHWEITIGGSYSADGNATITIVGAGGPFVITLAVTNVDTPTTLATRFKTAIQQNPKALKLVNPTSEAGVLDLAARAPGVKFEITNAAVPGTLTIGAVDQTPTPGELGLGLGVALDSTDADSIRTLVNADTAASLFGVTVEGAELKANTGEYDQDDVYEPQARATLITKGEVPVAVEHAIAIGDPVYVRKNATGSEVAGAFRMSADATDTVQLTNCRWLSASYSDAQGRLTAMLDLNLP